jgi:hypothetical protein
MRFVLLFAALASLTACKKQCTQAKTETHGDTFRAEWNGCSDDHEHSVECSMRGDEYTCNCNPGESFTPALAKGQVAITLTAKQAAEGCKWDFTP